MHKLSVLLLGALTAALPAQAPTGTTVEGDAPIKDALEALGEEVRVYDEHQVFLASPFLGGRLPGTRGMEITVDYIEHYLQEAGVDPPFVGADGALSYRQPFALGSQLTVTAQHLGCGGLELAAGRDFTLTGMGGSGRVEGEGVFIGYSVSDGPDGYDSFGDGVDLSGKVAVMMRFEPMDADGKSLWATSSPWSTHGSFRKKIAAAVDRGAAAIVVVNPPGADDPRASQLVKEASGRNYTSIPVFSMSSRAADRVLAAAGADSLMDLRRHADAGGGPRALGIPIALEAQLEEQATMAENVGGLLRGRGSLADELIVIGGHIDHLGMGEFGSRSGSRGELHPGADDNASGTAAILMLADRLAADYRAMPDDTPRRSILFMGFNAEESGLNGSNWYVGHPIFPIEQHALMINFDMIGRIENKRLQVLGTRTGIGLAEWVRPFFEASPLTVIEPERMSLGSDHIPFNRRGVPVLFGIIADFHDDYHTPRDESWKINRVDAVHTIDLFHEIAREAALRPERFVHTSNAQ